MFNYQIEKVHLMLPT